MRAKRPTRVLVMLLAVSLLPTMVVLATHNPQVSEVVAVATNPQTYNMSCKQSTAQVDCTAFDFDFTWSEFATIKPGFGNLLSLNTTAAVAPFWAAPLASSFRTWMTDLQAVPCNGISRTLTSFVASVGNLTTDGTVTPLTIPSECSLTGGLIVKRDVTGAPTEYDYWINSSVIVPPTPTPSPTPTPAPTPTPSPPPIPTPLPGTATPRPTATATATESASESASASASASESASASQTESASSSGSPEQTVAGITFTPEPSVPPGAPQQGVGGWPGSVPGTGEISGKPADVAGSALAAILLLAVMGFIGELFNNTMETNYDRIMGWWKKSWLGRVGRGLSSMLGGGAK